MKQVRRIRKTAQENRLVRARLDAAPEDVTTTNAKVALIQELIPLGLLWVEDALQQEVAQLAGARYQRGDGESGVVRYGTQPGSIYLADQKLGIAVPRVRDLAANREVALTTYRAMRQPRGADDGVLRRILAGVSCRDYARCAEAVPQAFGLSASTVSRRFVQVSSRHLQALRERRLESYDFVAVLLDGKTFAAETMVVAVGITLSGEKIVLGLVEAGTENATVCADLLTELVERGLRFADGLLVVIDGGKGLHKAVEKVFASAAFIQRCQWHKRENIVAYLPKTQQATWRRKLERAYAKPTYKEAKAALATVRRELVPLNESAARSLDEGLEETLTLHKLGVITTLGISLRTTNGIESINSLIEQRTGKVDYWKTSNQRQRWLATALLDIEPRLRRIKGCKHLPLLRQAMRAHMKTETTKAA
jgi:transposase-like protein